MIVYGLTARGALGDGWEGWEKFFSRKVFTKREDAEAYIPEFSAKCEAPDDLGVCLAPGAYKVVINELELDGFPEVVES